MAKFSNALCKGTVLMSLSFLVKFFIIISQNTNSFFPNLCGVFLFSMLCDFINRYLRCKCLTSFKPGLLGNLQ